MRYRPVFPITLVRWLWICFTVAVGEPGSKGEKTYVIDGQDRVSWMEALRRCRHRNMELVSIESRAENERLKRMIAPSSRTETPPDYWTGGHRTDDGRWRWIGGTPFRFVDWTRGAPNDYLEEERCLRLWGRHGYRWDDYFCDAKLHFICQRRGTSPVRPETPDQEGTELDGAERDVEENPEPYVDSGGSEEPDLEFNAKKLVLTGERAQLAEPPKVNATPRTSGRRGQEESTKGERWDPPESGRSLELRLRDLRVVFVLERKRKWDAARDECNSRGMEMAVVGTEIESRKIHRFLQENGLDRENYWIGHLRERIRRSDPVASDDDEDGMEPIAGQTPVRARKPWSLRLMIGLEHGTEIGTYQLPVGNCPLLSAVVHDGPPQLTFQSCDANHYFICEKVVPTSPKQNDRHADIPRSRTLPKQFY